jgi:hypothetical protein
MPCLVEACIKLMRLPEAQFLPADSAIHGREKQVALQWIAARESES